MFYRNVELKYADYIEKCISGKSALFLLSRIQEAISSYYLMEKQL
jgi:hypothetical protein